MNKLPFDAEDMARRRRRALVMALVLGFFVVLFFATTIAKMGSMATSGGSG